MAGPVLDVLQMLVDPYFDKRCWRQTSVQTDVRTAHGGYLDRLMREQETKLSFRFLCLFPRDDPDSTCMQPGVRKHVFEGMPLASH